MDLVEESKCPKVLGDIVESYIGAMLLDTGFNLREVWKMMMTLLEPVLTFNCLYLNPVRELRELCQHKNFILGLPDPVKENNSYLVKVEVDTGDSQFTTTAVNRNSKAGRRVAAQGALFKLKGLGYKHKNKTLEEILKTTRKREPELIGFDEDPLEIRRPDVGIIPRDNWVNQETPVNLFSLDKENVIDKADKWEESQQKAEAGDYFFNKKATESDQGIQSDIQNKKSAKSRLLEICAANYWSPPLFRCCNEEGPSHLRNFTFVVTVDVVGPTCTILECYGESRPQKKAAQDHAAQGAVWYLERLGYILRS
ncbi:hypothetical protein KSP40_PGU006191 [Platanthera guangdongensis]|uniref:DRBM domain-containing protein n=1 Tax=Platanthera guangdongensis TaxID=2320717 RepID=A0ABR2MF24_9ASPA